MSNCWYPRYSPSVSEKTSNTKGKLVNTSLYVLLVMLYIWKTEEFVRKTQKMLVEDKSFKSAKKLSKRCYEEG